MRSSGGLWSQVNMLAGLPSLRCCSTLASGCSSLVQETPMHCRAAMNQPMLTPVQALVVASQMPAQQSGSQRACVYMCMCVYVCLVGWCV